MSACWSRFWYPTAIAATAGVILSLSSSVGLPTSWVSFAGSTAIAKSGMTAPSNGLTAHDQEAFSQAMAMANQAVVAYQAAQNEADLTHRSALIQRERFLWQMAIQKLATISAQDNNYAQARLKHEQYQGLLANANESLAAVRQAWLQSIIESVGVDASTVHLTLCQMASVSDYATGDDDPPSIPSLAGPISALDKSWQIEPLAPKAACPHHQGDVPMASPASLIKLPIAIAAMDKAVQDNADFENALRKKIYIDPSNFTENAEGASVEIDQAYPLEQVVVRMINESNNIATNQLIDFIGRAEIAQSLSNRGYPDTLVDHKLAGDRILPPNPGTRSNQATSNDITAMLAGIYRRDHPGDEMLLSALRTQKDRELGYQALEDIQRRGVDVEWLGEKTGQNDRLIGSTLAMRVGHQRYALTVAIDHSGDPQAVRDIIQAVTHALSAARGYPTAEILY